MQRSWPPGYTADGSGLMINSSRGFIYAGNAVDFAQAARAAADDLRKTITHYR